MGSKKQFLMQSLKRAAALASVFGVAGGLSVDFASAQSAQHPPLTQLVEPAGFDLSEFQDYAVRLTPSYSQAPAPAQNSARILSSQPTYLPSPGRQATVNRRALVGRGRMISAGHRQDQGVLGIPPQDQEPSVLQRDDNQFFPTPPPSTPRNPEPLVPELPQIPDTRERQSGELPPNIFEDPFKGETRKPPVEIPGQELPAPPEDPRDREPDNSNRTPEQNQNPFVPKPRKKDDEIDYQPSRGLGATRSRSNVYRPPGSNDALEGDRDVYFVPAYDPIPGTQQRSLAPPATLDPNYEYSQQPTWPGQYAAPRQPQYGHPQYQQPQYQQPPYQQPPYQQPQYAPPQYQQPPHQPPQYAQSPYQYQPPQTQYGYPQGIAPAPAVHPEQQVYTPVVQPQINLARNNILTGPMTTARRGVMGKIKQNLKSDLGFGDYESCFDAGNCGGCSSGCCDGGCSNGSTCPVFYFGFQAAYNDVFDVNNDQGSELVVDDGTAYFFSLGRMNGRNLRTEFQLSFRNNDVSALLTPAGETALTGDLQTFSGMTNAYWEFVNSPTGRFKPYVGVGIGFLSATADLSLESDPSTAINRDESSSSFAYQLMAGINFKVSNHMDLFGEYRFVEADSFGIPSDLDDLSGDFGYKANSVGGGLRWKF